MDGNGQSNSPEGLLALSPLGLPAQSDQIVTPRKKRAPVKRKPKKIVDKNTPMTVPDEPTKFLPGWLRKLDFSEVNYKERRFVEEYLQDFNATRAYMRSGARFKNYNVAGVCAHQMLKRPNVAALVAKGKELLALKTEVTTEKLIKEWSRIAFSDLRDAVREDGSLIPLRELDDDTAAAISSVEVYEEFGGFGEERKVIGQTKKIRQWDKHAALTNLAKYLNLLHEKTEVTVTGQVNHAHAHVEVDWNKIPFEMRDKLLDAVVKQEDEQQAQAIACLPSQPASPAK